MKRKILFVLLVPLLLGCAKTVQIQAAPMPPYNTDVVDSPPTVDSEAVDIPKAFRQPIENIFFDVNVDTLRPGQVRQLSRLSEWSDIMGNWLVVTGYADTTGSTEYNTPLSYRRACAVAARLPRAICVGSGETKDFGIRLHSNRRATILSIGIQEP